MLVYQRVTECHYHSLRIPGSHEMPLAVTNGSLSPTDGMSPLPNHHFL